MTSPQAKSNMNLPLSRERFFQLRQLADDLGGKTMSETLAQLFAAARETGLMKGHNVPGVRVNRVSDGIVIQFDDGPRASFDSAGAHALTNMVRQFVDGRNTGPHLIDLDYDFSVRRKGRGFIVTIGALTENKSSKSWNSDLATEFADLIDQAIEQHEMK